MVNLITEHMDIWTAAQTQKTKGGRGRGKNANGQSPHGIKKLRELILDLTVRGKLVPQDPSDEPASDLLNKLAKEKARLIKEGKIKKQKPLPEITENEKPFELPDGWEWARFGVLPLEAFTGLDKGKSLQSLDFQYLYFKMNNILNDGGFDLADITRVDATPAELEKYSLENGDFLFNTRNSRALVGKTCVIKGLSNEPFLYNNNILRAKLPFVSPIFIDYWFRSVSGKLLLEEKKSSTTNVCAIYQGKLFEMLCVIPPLAEQRRIVAKVDELMALCDQLEQQQTDSNATHQFLVETVLTTLTNATDQRGFAKTWQRIAKHFETLFTTEHNIDQLKQTILQLAVMGKLVPQDPNDEPARVLLEKITKEKTRLIKEGEIKKQKPLQEITEDEKPFDLPEGWEWAYVGECFSLKSGTSFNKEKEMRSGQYIYAKVADMNLEGNEVEITTSSRFIDPSSKDLKAIIPAGSIVFPKRGGAIATNKKRLVTNDLFVDLNIMAITPFEGVNLDFAYRWLLGIDLAILNSGTSVPQINNKDIAPLLFPVPPLREQHRIVAKVVELMALCDSLKDRLEDAQTTQVQLADAIVEQAVA